MLHSASKAFFHLLARIDPLKALASRYGMRHPSSFARRFIAGETIDEVITVDDRTAYDAVFEIARSEGIFTGSSGGAAGYAAREVARRAPDDALVVTLFPDSGERYLSKLNPDWLKERGLSD